MGEKHEQNRNRSKVWSAASNADRPQMQTSRRTVALFFGIVYRPHEKLGKQGGNSPGAKARCNLL